MDVLHAVFWGGWLFFFSFFKDKLYFHVDLSEGLPIKWCTFLIVLLPVDATADWLGCSSVGRKGILKLMSVSCFLTLSSSYKLLFIIFSFKQDLDLCFTHTVF